MQLDKNLVILAFKAQISEYLSPPLRKTNVLEEYTLTCSTAAMQQSQEETCATW
jgi:hypothetical protein